MSQEYRFTVADLQAELEFDMDHDRGKRRVVVVAEDTGLPFEIIGVWPTATGQVAIEVRPALGGPLRPASS